MSGFIATWVLAILTCVALAIGALSMFLFVTFFTGCLIVAAWRKLRRWQATKAPPPADACLRCYRIDPWAKCTCTTVCPGREDCVGDYTTVNTMTVAERELWDSLVRRFGQ